MCYLIFVMVAYTGIVKTTVTLCLPRLVDSGLFKYGKIQQLCLSASYVQCLNFVRLRTEWTVEMMQCIFIGHVLT